MFFFALHERFKYCFDSNTARGCLTDFNLSVRRPSVLKKKHDGTVAIPQIYWGSFMNNFLHLDLKIINVRQFSIVNTNMQ